jgi:hypothetical protein
MDGPTEKNVNVFQCIYAIMRLTLTSTSTNVFVKISMI